MTGEFNYLDIYASKGLEYLFVVGFLVALAALAWVLSRKSPGKKEPR
jgi:hypothetical protein